MNNARLWMTLTTLGRELRALNTMSNLELWLTWMTSSYDIRPLDAMNSSRLWMTWIILGRELRALDAMNNSGFYMNDSWSWAQDCKCYEQLRTMDDMNNYRSWAQGFRYYKKLRAMVDLSNIVDDMNDLGSCELRPLDTMNNSNLLMLWMILCHELKVLDDMNDFG